MAGINFIGSYSGIDQATIDKLMEAERMPLNQLTRKHVNITGKRDAWKDVNTRLNSLFEKMKALKNSSTFNTKTAASSDTNYVSMSAGNGAAEGKYTVKVGKLATNSTIVGSHVKVRIKTGEDQFDEVKINASTALGEPDEEGKVDSGIIGKFSIKGSEETAEITIKGSHTLRDVVNNINKTTKDSTVDGKTVKGTGVSAAIVDNRIVLTDEKTGERNIELKGLQYAKDPENPDVLSGPFELSKIGLNIGTGEDDAVFRTGNDAEFTLNEIKITSSSNRVTDVIDGVVINLNKEHAPGQSDTVNISMDTSTAVKAVEDFVAQYNSTMKFIEEKTAAGDPKIPGSKGVLAGESSLIRLQSTLRTLVTDRLSVEGSNILDASQIGISTIDKYGELKFDSGEFLKALREDKDSVMNFLNPGVNSKGDKQLGLVDRVNDYINGFISKSDGIIKDKNESFDKSLKDLSTRIENFETRMEKKEAHYVKMFTALDLAMMKAEDQMGWLQGQVDAMNGIKR